MRLSVILPCRNAAATLEEQLGALARQQRPPFEVVAVDNGSTDRTPALLQGYRDRMPSLRVVEAGPPHSAAHARNRGVAAATGEAFAFCDADDEVHPGWAGAMADALARHDVVASRVDDSRLNAGRAGAIWDSSNDPTPGFVVFLGFLPAASGCGFGFTRRAWDAIGPFDESFQRLEDIDYSWRAHFAGFPIHYAHDAVVYYRYRASLGGTWRQCVAEGRYEARLYEKYRSRGMAWRPLRQAAGDWGRLVRSLPALRRPDGRALWIKCAGSATGHVAGSIRHRVLAL
ncbi:glycosyl transferase family 2 [Sulfurifustis variabilis]|uniref:Glycosyl transferase family 2 n=1 Tax=Sulfurifustis variabilis TaxID=1675686 RepID=A0A1B4V3F4_9GAMM|nr:glycosyltransferase [Sulfurifustis variabilis]BAU48090.1 glycosyl transferase family 2 [Sulfurifustis variabilis]